MNRGDYATGVTAHDWCNDSAAQLEEQEDTIPEILALPVHTTTFIPLYSLHRFKRCCKRYTQFRIWWYPNMEWGAPQGHVPSRVSIGCIDNPRIKIIRYTDIWSYDDISSLPDGKMDGRKAVGLYVIFMAGGISNLPCDPVVTVVARCCAGAFKDGFVVRIADTRATSSLLYLYHVASWAWFFAFRMVVVNVLSISMGFSSPTKSICGNRNGALGSKTSCSRWSGSWPLCTLG